MNLSLFYTISTWIVCSTLFVLMLASIYAGRKLARSHVSDNPGNSSLTSSLYALLGLLLAFTFSMSADRFKERKQVIVQEANCIGTAILRTRLYADSVQPEFKKNFQAYLEARIKYFASHGDTVKLKKSISEATDYSYALWALATQQSKIEGNLIASNQMIPALNEMFDIANTRYWGELERTPTSILVMLFILSFATAFAAGYTSVVDNGKVDKLMSLSFCFLISLVIFFIIDLDKPRQGVITLDQNVRAIIDLRSMF